MTNIFGEQHTSGQYERELKSFFNHLLKMSDLAEKIVRTVLDSFDETPDNVRDLAKFSHKKEKRINRMEVKLDQMSRDIYTRRTPLASDFRLMTASTKIVTDLERIGDEIQHIADIVYRVVSSEYGANLKDSLRQLINEIKSTAHETTVCLSELDQVGAQKIIVHDRIINDCYDKVYADMVTLMKNNPEQIDAALDIIWTARSIERIGDHCRNIAESVIFVVEGRDVRHPKRKKEKKSTKAQSNEDADAPDASDQASEPAE